MEHRTQGTRTETQRLRLAALGGVLGPVLFTVVVLVAGALYEGYSHVSQKISELGGQEAEFAVVQNVNFVVLGLFTLGFAWALGRALGRPYRGPILVGFFAVSSAIANGLLPCDPGCLGLTPVSQAHNITGLLGFIGAIIAMVTLARRWRGDPRWQGHAALSAAAAVVATCGLIWFVATQALDRQALAGIAQRTFVAALLVWIAATAWHLHRHLGEAGPALDEPLTAKALATAKE